MKGINFDDMRQPKEDKGQCPTCGSDFFKRRNNMYMPYKDVIKLLRDIKINIRIKSQDEQEAFIEGAIEMLEKMNEGVSEEYAESTLDRNFLGD